MPTPSACFFTYTPTYLPPYTLQGSMMRHFSSSVGVQRLGPNHCRLEMSLMMQPSIYVPFGVRHMVSGQVSSNSRLFLLLRVKTYEELCVA